MKYFEFTKQDYDYIVKECMLDEEYQKLLEYKIKGYSRVKIAMKLNVTEYTVDKMLQKLKKKLRKFYKKIKRTLQNGVLFLCDNLIRKEK